MKVLYFDCFSGISGDMALGALLDLGVSADILKNELKKLTLPGWDISVSRVIKHGISATGATVMTGEGGQCRYSHTLGDAKAIINHSSINPNAKDISASILERIARAVGKVHGKPTEEVYLTEKLPLDSIIHIVGVAILVDVLKPENICASVINDGHGFTQGQHGTTPVPMPVVAEICREKGARLAQLDIDRELVTVTGAAIVSELAGFFGKMPPMNIEKVGYGAGMGDLSIPNVLRLIMGETGEKCHDITMLDTNIDDITPEIAGYVMEKFLRGKPTSCCGKKQGVHMP